MNQVLFSVSVTNLNKQNFQQVASFLQNLSANEPAITGVAKNTLEEVATAPKGKRGRPAKTVSPDEDEEFGTKALAAKDLESEEEAKEVEQDDDAPAHDWDEVTDVINQFGAKNPKAMKEILNTFNFKTTKELKQCPNRWDAVYTRVKKQLKALKKSRD